MDLQKDFFYTFAQLYRFRSLIWNMAVRDFKTQYVKSYLGFTWALIQPTVFFGVLYFVFSSGLRQGGNSDGFPFVVYLAIGMSSWFFFSGLLNSGANVIRANNFLVRSSGFELAILAPVKAISNLFLHLFFLFVVLVIAIANDVDPSFYWLQIPYYILSASVLLIGVSWFTSSVAVFIPDVNKAIPLLVQIGFWATPIFWNINSFSAKAQVILKFNPAFYIVNGYRESILYSQWFWESPELTLYYWGISLLFLFSGLLVFRQLRPHFAEIL